MSISVSGIKRLQKLQDDLVYFKDVYGVRLDWQEPDEQDVDAIVTGVHLDNAMGANQGSIPAYSQELVVHLTVEGGVEISINLADLLAMATIRPLSEVDNA
jgi:hypothetical protein